MIVEESTVANATPRTATAITPALKDRANFTAPLTRWETGNHFYPLS
jgi:hypothetical protein